MGNIRAARSAQYVVPFTGAGFKYGFNTNANAAVRTALGHSAVLANTVGVVFGANTPKPGRASKDGDTSFIDVASRAAAKAAGWRLTPSRFRSQRNSLKTRAVYVVLGAGVKYAWRMSVTTYNAIAADRVSLGILDCDPSVKDYVTGASPKPPSVKKIISDESYTTFCDPDSLDALPAGWNLAGSGKTAIIE